MAFGRPTHRATLLERRFSWQRNGGKAALLALLALAAGAVGVVVSCSLGPDDFRILDVAGSGATDGGTGGQGGDGNGGSDGNGGAAGGGGDSGNGGSGGGDGTGGTGSNEVHSCTNVGLNFPVTGSLGTDELSSLIAVPHPDGTSAYVAVLASSELAIIRVTDSGNVHSTYEYSGVPLHSFSHMELDGSARMKLVGRYHDEAVTYTVPLDQGGSMPVQETLATPAVCTGPEGQLRRFVPSRVHGAGAYTITCYDGSSDDYHLYLGPDLTFVSRGHYTTSGGGFYGYLAGTPRMHFIHVGEEANDEILFRSGPDPSALAADVKSIAFTDPASGIVAPMFRETPEGDELFVLTLRAEGDLDSLGSAQVLGGSLGAGALDRLTQVPPSGLIPGPSFSTAAEVVLFGDLSFTSARAFAVGAKLDDQTVSATWLDRDGNVLVFDHEVYSSPEFAIDRYVVVARVGAVTQLVAWGQRDALGNRTVRAQRVSCSTTSTSD